MGLGAWGVGFGAKGLGCRVKGCGFLGNLWDPVSMIPIASSLMSTTNISETRLVFTPETLKLKLLSSAIDVHKKCLGVLAFTATSSLTSER